MSNFAKLHDKREFLKRLEDELRLAQSTQVITTININAQQAETLLALINLADACTCRVSALEAAALYEIAARAAALAKVMP